MDNKRGVDLAGSDHLVDFLVGLAKNAHGVPRGFERAVGSLLIRSRLFQFALRNSGKALDALQFFVGQFERRRRADER